MPQQGPIDPNDILFSLPTICDPAPATEAKPPPAGHRALHEDDWRQIEFVAMANQAHIRRELATLIQFKEQHWDKVGWRKCYVRKEHPTPFAALSLTVNPPPSLTNSGLTLGGGVVVGGLSLWESSGWFFYGQQTPQRHLLHFALTPSVKPPTVQFAGLVSAFATAAGTMLVDWYRCIVVDTATAESVLEWAKTYA